jgi:hypothetical protein
MRQDGHMIPMRYIFRSRWAALAWAAGICFSAVHFAGGAGAKVGDDAVNSADGNAAQTAALIADLQ